VRVRKDGHPLGPVTDGAQIGLLPCWTPHPHPTPQPFSGSNLGSVCGGFVKREGASGAYLYHGSAQADICGFVSGLLGFPARNNPDLGLDVAFPRSDSGGVGRFPARRVQPAETLKGVESMRLTPSFATVAIVGAFVAFVLLPLLAAWVEGVLL
jgi:hypothetical protein